MSIAAGAVGWGAVAQESVQFRIRAEARSETYHVGLNEIARAVGAPEWTFPRRYSFGRTRFLTTPDLTNFESHSPCQTRFRHRGTCRRDTTRPLRAISLPRNRRRTSTRPTGLCSCRSGGCADRLMMVHEHSNVVCIWSARQYETERNATRRCEVEIYGVYVLQARRASITGSQ